MKFESRLDIIVNADVESWYLKFRQKVKKRWEIRCTLEEFLYLWIVNDKRNYRVKINSGGTGHKAGWWQSWSRTQALRPWTHVVPLSAAYKAVLTTSKPYVAHFYLDFLLPPTWLHILALPPNPPPGILIYNHFTSFAFLGKTAKGNANREGRIMSERKTF